MKELLKTVHEIAYVLAFIAGVMFLYFAVTSLEPMPIMVSFAATWIYIYIGICTRVK